MSVQNQPTPDPNWEHLRIALAKARMQPPPKSRNYGRILEIIALTILTLGVAVFVKLEVSDTPDGTVTAAIEQFENRVTALEEQALSAVHLGIVNAHPSSPKPTPKVAKPKKTSMLEEDSPAPGNNIRVEESVKQLPQFQVEIVDRNQRRVFSTDDKRMVVEVAQPGAMSAAGDQPRPTRNEPVVLRAHINKDGSIEKLTLLSGPAELSTAAIETVKGLHYQPSYKNGAAVESDADITVNFVPSK